MKKLPMCRICLVQNVRMYVVVNEDLHELYEKLTDIPFVTEDCRPMLACFLCCTKLKQCCQFRRKCLKAEELFAQMMKEDYEPGTLIHSEHSTFYNGFIKTPIVHIIIDDVGQTETLVIKEELPDVSEALDDIVNSEEGHKTDSVPKVITNLDTEHNYCLPRMKLAVSSDNVEMAIPSSSGVTQNTGPEFQNVDNTYPDLEHTTVHHADSEADVPLLEIKIKVEEDPDPIGEPEIPEAAVPTEQKENEDNRKSSCVSEKNKETDNNSSTPMTYNESITETEQGIDNSINHTALSTICSNNSNRDDIKTNRDCIKETRFECDICHRSFSTKCYLIKHLRLHIDEKSLKCDICQRGFYHKDTLAKHVRIHTGMKPYKCEICLRTFNSKSTLTRHINIHTGEKPFKCEICPRSFYAKSTLIRHMRIHTGEKPFKCEICQRSFNRTNNLAIHTRLHTGEYPFKCDKCHRGFNRNSQLTAHACTRGDSYLCDICQRGFIKKKALIKHISVHYSRVKPLKCDICPRIFKAKSKLTRHIRIHTGEKPFKCEICQHGFRRSTDLAIHTRLHTGEYPFKCDKCERGFNRMSRLTAHICTIDGEILFNCTLCQRSFKRKSSFTIHTRKHAREQ